MKNLTVYVTSLATNQTSSLGTVYALDAATGRPAGPTPSETREVEPGGRGGTVYVGSDRKVYALDAGS